MGYILILLISVGLSETTLDERKKSDREFRKKFKQQYGYEWGVYGFNVDSEWETSIDKLQPERAEERDEMMDVDAEASMGGQ